MLTFRRKLAIIACTMLIVCPTTLAIKTNTIFLRGTITYPSALAKLQVEKGVIRSTTGPLFLIGCNVRGQAYNPRTDGKYDDWYTYRYSDAQNIESYGFNTIRLTMYWEEIELSNSPSDFLYNDTYVELVRKTVEAYNEKDIYVILDLHQHSDADELQKFVTTSGNDADYADAFYSDISNTSAWEHLRQLWLRISQTFKYYKGVAGYDILNEPHRENGSLSPQEVADLWFDISDYVVSALRTEGDSHVVFIEFCPAARHTNYMSRKLNDSNVVYEPHFYYGINTSDLSVLNNDYSWLKEQFDANVNAKMLDFGVPFIMGEQGFGGNQLTNDQSIWLENAIAISKSNPLMQGWLYWCYIAYDGIPQGRGGKIS